jgi:hypothetical protein
MLAMPKKSEGYVIYFSRPRKWDIGSWIIRKTQNTAFSHVAIYYDEQVYESTLRDIKPGQSLKDWLEYNDIIMRVDMAFPDGWTEVQTLKFQRILRFAMRQPYSLSQVLGIWLSDQLGLKSNPFPNGRNAYICSELVAQALRHTGFDPFISKRRDLITPKDLYTALREGLTDAGPVK